MAWFQVNFISNCLTRPVPLHVILPVDGMTLSAGKEINPFKTLYLLHGYLGGGSDWLIGSQVDEISKQFNIAIVMPTGANDFYVDAARAGNNYSSYISCELIDFTRRLFPLSNRREDTILAGLSMGGFGTLYNCFAHSEVFGHGIALSAPMVLEKEHLDTVTDEPNFMGVTKGFYREVFSGDISTLPESTFNPRVTAKELMNSGKPIPDMYIACGWNDTLRDDNRKLTKALDEIGFPYFYEEGPGSHEWAFWTPYLRRGLEHVLNTKGETMPNPFWVECDHAERSGE